MARTFLVGSQTGVWREWLRANLGEGVLLSLDPANPEFGFPGVVAAYQSDRTLHWRFMGSLSIQRSPHILAASLAPLLGAAGSQAIIESFPYRPSPLRCQLLRMCVQAAAPERIVVDRRCHLDPHGWPAPFEEVELEPGPPPVVAAGLRKARWLQLEESGESHAIDLRRIAVDGLRLGAGVPVPLENLRRFGFQNPLHGEVAGNTLLAISDAPVDDLEVSRALDSLHASKAVIVPSSAYSNLLCAFSREDGVDFALGRLVSIEFPDMLARVRANAVPQTPVPVIKVGGLRVDGEGRETGELKPWEA